MAQQKTAKIKIGGIHTMKSVTA